MMFSIILSVHFILASIVSAHILLTKKQVGAAVGWLGVTWLSPIIGAFFYFIFGINRVARRAKKIQRVSGDKSWSRTSTKVGESYKASSNACQIIQRVGNELSEFPVVSGNSVEIFENGDEAYPEMLTAIGAAEKTIALCSYIFRMDPNGREFVSALIDAHNRGVEIKVLIDGVGGGLLKCPAVSELSAAGIDARRFLFSLVPWEMSYLNLRNHKKLLVVDGETAFVGGMNIGGENLLRRKRPGNVRDTHFRFRGSVVQQLLQSFAEDWLFTSDHELSGDGWWITPKKKGPIAARVINSGPDHELGNVEAMFAAGITAAKKRLRIVTPYFLPDEKTQYLIELAVLRGVSVDILVPEKTDFRFFDWAMEGQLNLMNLQGVNFRRTAQPFDHTKLLTVDDEWCAIGSPNWDVRSMQLNFEILVECYDLEIVDRINQIIDTKMEESKENAGHRQGLTGFLSGLRNASARLLMPYL